jgi:PEP-CTERM motif-containing protein
MDSPRVALRSRDAYIPARRAGPGGFLESDQLLRPRRYLVYYRGDQHQPAGRGRDRASHGDQFHRLHDGCRVRDWVTGTAAVGVNRSAAGDTVGFVYDTPPALGIPPGNESMLVEIDTNAPSWTGRALAVLDGQTVKLNGFSPAVPEPSTWAMLGLGFAGLGLLA